MQVEVLASSSLIEYYLFLMQRSLIDKRILIEIVTGGVD
jgi:hypothetical protein